MTKTNKRHDAVELTETEWSALLEIAEQVEAYALTGSTAGQPSWRRMLKEIANGGLIVSRVPFNFFNEYTWPKDTPEKTRKTAEYWQTRGPLERELNELWTESAKLERHDPGRNAIEADIDRISAEIDKLGPE